MQYEEGVPDVAAQTAYGIEAEVEGYEESYDPSAMLFMDFRRHHTGLYDNTANRYRAFSVRGGGLGWGGGGSCLHQALGWGEMIAKGAGCKAHLYAVGGTGRA